MSASPPGPRRRGPLPRARVSLSLVAATIACSTIAATPDPEECRSDDDCATGFVCAADQGRCLPGNEAAPRAHLGFDIRERVAGNLRFRVEVAGCDCTIEEEENIRELALRRARVSQEFFLSAYASEEPPDDTMEDPLLPAVFELTQASRFGLAPSPQQGYASHPTVTGPDETVVDTVMRWPRYHPLDQGVPPDLVLWMVDPDEDLALRYLGLLPPRTNGLQPCEVDSDCCTPQGACNPAPNYCDTTVGECTAVGKPEWTYRYTYDRRCSRALEGFVVSLDPQTHSIGAGLADATVRVRYANGLDGRLGTPVFNPGRALTCEADEDCGGPALYCDTDVGECRVTLADRLADRGRTTDPTGRFRTAVYTYCEAQPNAAVPRRYEVTVQPGGPRPTVEYIVDVPFTPPAQPGSGYTLGNDLCVPDWGPGATLQLALRGTPRALAGASGEYTCCDVGCLPSTADDVAKGSPSAPQSCDGRTTTGAVPSVRVESHFFLESLADWIEADCMTPNPDPQGRLGSFSRTADCTATGQPCRVDDVAVGTASQARRYEVRFESEPGSVLASGDFVVELGPGAPPLQTLDLSPRVLVTGVVDVDAVICARRPTGEDCAARAAVVLAERLRLPGERDGSVPGPYFHSVSTFYDPVAGRDGAFVLPLDPGGVYVVTALPLAGAEGGPARYTLVDLRAAATLSPLRLVLEDGVVVTLRLEQFDQRTTVIPLDRGSHRAPGNTLELPGADAIIDLDEIGACWTPPGDGPQACKIRRLIPLGYDLARTQVGVVRFTARRSDAAQCTVRCPMGPPSP
jgi:hypothetical protein